MEKVECSCPKNRLVGDSLKVIALETKVICMLETKVLKSEGWILTGREYVPAVTTIVWQLLMTMCRSVGTNSISPTWLCSCREAAMVPSLSEVATITRSLFMSMETGLEGVGSEEIRSWKVVDAERASPLASWKPTLRLTTSEVQVRVLVLWTTSTERGRSWKLSNSSGKVRQSQDWVGMAMDEVQDTVKKVVCRTSMLELTMPVSTMDPYPAVSGFTMLSTTNRSLYSVQESAEEEAAMPMKTLSVTQSALPLRQAARGQGMPQTLRMQVSLMGMSWGLLQIKSWYGVWGSWWQSMGESQMVQQMRQSSFQMRWEQYLGRLSNHWVLASTTAYWLTMVKVSCCSKPSVLKQGCMMIWELTLSARVGNCWVDCSLLKAVQERSQLRRQMMLSRSCSIEEGVMMPQICTVKLPALSSSCRPSNRIWQYFKFRLHTAGIYTPAPSSNLMFSLASRVLRLARSLLITMAKDSSLLSWRGRVNFTWKQLATIGLFFEQDTSVMQTGWKSATDVSRIRFPHSITQLLAGSRSSTSTQCIMVSVRMDTPQIFTEYSRCSSSLPSALLMVSPNWFLSVLDWQSTDTGIPVVESSMLHMSVETCMPVKQTTILDSTSSQLLGVKVRVQQVLSTPSEMTLQLKLRVLRWREQKTPLSWFMSSLQLSIVPVLSTRQMEQYGRSSPQGSLMESRVMLKPTLTSELVASGMQVRNFSVSDKQIHIGDCSVSPTLGFALTWVVLQVELSSKNCQSDTIIRAAELDDPEQGGFPGVIVMDTLSLQDPAHPASWILFVSTLALEDREALAAYRQVGLPVVGLGSMFRYLTTRVSMFLTPTMISNCRAEEARKVVGRMMLKSVVVSELSSTMSTLSQSRGNWSSRLDCVPWRQVKVKPGTLLLPGQGSPLLREVNKLVQPWQANTEMILRSQDCTTSSHWAVSVLRSLNMLGKLVPELFKSLTKWLLKLVSWLRSGMTSGTLSRFLEAAEKASETVREKQKWQMFQEWEEENRNLRLEMTTVVAVDCGNRLQELLEAMVMVVKVELELSVQASGLPAIVQELAGRKLEEATRDLEVMILRKEPALVRKLGVTVKDMRESEFCMASSLLSSPCAPVRLVRQVSGTAAELLLTVPRMMGLPMLASSSMLTVMVKMEADPISTRMVNVMVELCGMRGNPLIRTPLLEQCPQTTVSAVTVEVVAKTEPS